MKPNSQTQMLEQMLEAKLQKRIDEKLHIEQRIQRLRKNAVILENKIDRIKILVHESVQSEQ